MDFHLSMSSYPCGKSPEKAVRALAKAGFHYAELGSEHGEILLARGPEAWKKFREYAESFDVKFRQGHLPLHDDITERDEAKRLHNVSIHRNFCRMYHAIGITSAVLHCGGYDAWKKGETDEQVRARRTLSLKDLLSDLPEGMTICLENLPSESFEDVEANIIAAGNPPNLGFCLDTGHLHFSFRCRDHVSYIRRAGKRLKAMHMHDNVGPMGPGDPKYNSWHNADKHMFPGFFSGSIDWEHLVAALREVGYSDLWNLEVGADFDSRIPSESYRELVMKQNHDRAEMIFSFDSESPAPDDPVNDFSKFEKVSSNGVAVSYEKFKIAVSAEKYTLKVDPVHAGRICSWRALGRDMLPDDRAFGWGVFSIWQPKNVSMMMTQGMTVESVKAVKEGVEIRLAATFDEDCEALKGGKLEMVYTFTPASILVCAKVTAAAGALPFSARLHCMPLLLGGKGLPVGTIRFDDGTEMVRSRTPNYFRVGEVNEKQEHPMGKNPVITVKVPEAVFVAPGVKGTLRVTYPGEKPQGFCLWDTESNQCTFEPIFAERTLKAGESAEFSCLAEIR